MSDLFDLLSTFPDGTPHDQPHLSHLNAATWTCPVPPGCKGLVLRKLYDRFHGRQRARVLVDATPVGFWYEADEDRTHRWGWGQFGIEARHLRGKREIELTIEPPAGVPLWDVARYEAWALVPE